ncbi:unnamed protein product [Macrosiphum euphorbiae]|uniref:THAP-type domain-containing protein n=1 Tax=Macrosiphum euphorbiae TaxID=13131 RepID=A0AAV0WL26_9HEMI|nr:unnamed protein product [Macrosiphum euphorbiae]
MVVYCCVDVCFNRLEYGSKIHFFSFPLKNEFRTTEWMKAINRKGFKPSASSRICSDHFTLNDFENSPGGSYHLYLTDKSCPSIFPITFDESHKKKNKSTFTEESTCSQNVDCILGIEVSENAPVHDNEITISRDNLLIKNSKNFILYFT